MARGKRGSLGNTWKSSGKLKAEKELSKDSKWRKAPSLKEDVVKNTKRDVKAVKDNLAKAKKVTGGARGSVQGAALRAGSRLASRLAGPAGVGLAAYDVAKYMKEESEKSRANSVKNKTTIRGRNARNKKPEPELKEVKVTAKRKEAPKAKPKPNPAPKAKVAPKKSSGGRKMRGDELADFLGLSKDSAVRKNLRKNK